LEINELQLVNFHGFDRRSITFHESFTALVGDNGTGKTGILDGLAIALGSYLSGIDGVASRHIRRDEIYRKTYMHGELTDVQMQFPVEVTCTGIIDGMEMHWSRFLNGVNGATTSKEARNIKEYATNLQEDVRQGSSVILPVISYYGTGRLWTARRELKRDKFTQDRFEGYRNCLEPDSDEKQFRTWIEKMTYIELQRGKTPAVLKAVREAISNCLREWKTIEYDVDAQEVRLRKDDGTVLPFDLLSDGLRNTIGMVADIAHRMAMLNPFVEEGVVKETPGVILIDEIDLHLHPKWQRTIVNDLKRTFPKVQFIVTTHSPFIIQSLEPGELRRLHHEDDEETVLSEEFVGRSIEDITEVVMEVGHVQRSEQKQRMFEVAKQYYRLLEQGKGAKDHQLVELKNELDEIEAMYSDDVAYYAFLTMEREAAGMGRNNNETH